MSPSPYQPNSVEPPCRKALSWQRPSSTPALFLRNQRHAAPGQRSGLAATPRGAQVRSSTPLARFALPSWVGTRHHAGIGVWLVAGSLGLLSLTPLARAQRIMMSDTTARPVAVESAEIATEVTGTIAVTTFDLVFRNPNNRQLEGTFEFPLLEGQSVVRFALDVGGRLREAVPVDKTRGREVFEEIERRRVDPGLLEQTVGNNYRARIFPLPAKGTRRILIAYQERIASRASGAATYRLALDLPAKLKRFALALAVHTGAQSAPQLHTTLPLELPEWSEAKVLKVERSDFNARGVLEVKLPPVDVATLVTETIGTREYFSAEVPTGNAVAAPRTAPEIVGILWDASGSGRDRDHAKEYAFLDAWFRAISDVEVRLIFLRDVAAPAEAFRVRHGDWSALRRMLEETIYDGATSFDGVTDDASVQEWMLFSDGLMNYGTSIAASRLPVSAPVHALIASARADVTRLQSLAIRNRGEFANLLTLEAAAAASRVRTTSLRVLGIDYDPEAMAQVFPEPGAPVLEANLVVSGVLRRSEAVLHIRIGHSASDTRDFKLQVKSGTESGELAARAWAAAKIAALSLDPANNREDIRRTSQEFGIVTSDTSLIVLESLDDYLHYDILPPEDLRAEWESRRHQTQATLGKQRDSHLDEVVRAFEEKTDWWGKQFPKALRVPAKAPVNATAGEPSPRSGSSMAASAVSGGSDSAEEIVVMTPFVVEADEDRGYMAASTLAGTRIRTDLPDAVSANSTRSSETPQNADPAGNRDLRFPAAKAEVGGLSGTSALSPSSPGITLQPWSQESGYIDHLRRRPAPARYAAYIEERTDHLLDAGFYLDVAQFFFEEKDSALGLRILSNLAELQLEDAPLLRILAHRLLQANRPELAVPLFERVMKIRSEEPQSRRDLALACASTHQYQRAVDLLWEIVEKRWSERFPQIELMALGELNAIAATCGRNLDLSKVDPRLRRNLAVGLRAVLTWDSDNCDIDLWVDDPNGERAIYSNNRTVQGGRMSCDFTGGYGPEEFLLKQPMPGKYTVRINYFGDRRTTALGPVTAQVRLITGFGTSEQKEQSLSVRLASSSQTLVIGSIDIPAP